MNVFARYSRFGLRKIRKFLVFHRLPFGKTYVPRCRKRDAYFSISDGIIDFHGLLHTFVDDYRTTS